MNVKGHRAVQAGNPDHPTVICSECLVVWPCLTSQRAAARKAMSSREKELAEARREMRDSGAADLFEAES
jgi:hypothetical protein